MDYALASTATPVLNTPDFKKIFGGEDGATLPLDAAGLLRAIETTALPQTKFKILKEYADYICEIETADYPCLASGLTSSSLFVDRRFLKPATLLTPERPRTMPDSAQIFSHFKELVGLPYTWGCNWQRGVPEMLNYYPPQKHLSTLHPVIQSTWSFHGLDCSGLLYLVTDGCVPRNTSDLIYYGEAVFIEGMNLAQILSVVRPLDLIAWKGHVVIVFDVTRAIESRAGHGVVIVDLAKRLSEILGERTPVNSINALGSAAANSFVVRRWHSEHL